MENRELDNLFKSGLETTATYHTAEEQWEVVAARLAEPRRRKPVLWWLLGGGMGILVLCLVYLPKAGGSPPVISAFQIPIATAIKPSEDAVANKAVSSEYVEKVTQAENYLPAFAKKRTSVIASNSKQGQSAMVSIADFSKEDGIDQARERGKAASLVNSSVGLNPDPIIGKKESSNFSVVVKNIMTLPLREIAPDSIVNTPIIADRDLEKPPVVVPATVARWGLEVGVQHDFITSGKIADDNANLQFYTAGALNFLPHWQARLAYGRGEIERTITSDPGIYHIPVIDAPQEGDLPTTTELRYRNQNLEVQLAYHLPKLKKLAFSIHTGLQWNKDTELNAVYEYEGIYQPETIVATLPDTQLLLSDLTAGVDLSYPLISAFSLHGGFQQYFSLNGSDAFRWPSRRRVHLGLSYQF